ncbi:MAG: PD40 domain-containing protein [Flavobacteriaceae bacterium]|nr:PD40 domain-containing protein [Flavobacteriaceae bacterium]
MKVESTLETVAIENGNRTIIHSEKFLFEVPNWTPDGKYLIINSEGKLYKVPVIGGGMTQINTGLAVKCNNDHGISPDGSMLVVSHNDSENPEEQHSSIYTLPFEGGTPVSAGTGTDGSVRWEG